MKKLLFCLLIGTSNLAFAQSIKEIDSLSEQMCTFLRNMDIQNDTMKMDVLYQQQFLPYLSNLEQSKTEKVGQLIYFRLQRNCVEFRALLDRVDPPAESVARITEKPKSNISKKQINDFKNQKEFYYYESSGNTTQVMMQEGKWIDSFTDKTFSKLNYNWIKGNEFELIFIESDNETRANFSVPGDKFIYQILSKEDGYYLMSVQIPGQNVYEKIKLYYK